MNTSEMVDKEKRLEVIDKYAQKLINSEYTLEQTRDAIIGGLKGYERLLSLSLDVNNPRWKPLHIAAGWNSRNRRVAKQRTKNNRYKGKTEVEPPTSPKQEIEATRFSIHQEDPSGHQEDPSIQQEDQSIHQEDQDQPEGGVSVMEVTEEDGQVQVKTGQEREDAEPLERGKPREKQRLRRKLGESNVPVHEGWKRQRGPLPPTRSVLFVDNTAGGELARRFQKAKEEAGMVTGYRIRITEI